MAALSAAAASGDRRATLEALRDVLADSVLEADPDKRAPLAKQLREIVAEIEALPVKDERTKVGDLAARRSARLSTPKAAV